MVVFSTALLVSPHFHNFVNILTFSSELSFDFSFFLNQFILFLLSNNSILLSFFNVFQGSVKVFLVIVNSFFKLHNGLRFFSTTFLFMILHGQLPIEDFVHFLVIVILQSKNLSIICSQVIVSNISFFKFEKRCSNLTCVVKESSFL